MKRGLSIVALLLGTLVPELALAKEVADVRFAADAADVVLTVKADEALRAPSVRTYAGSVRVRFYDADQSKLVTVEGDGSAVRSVELGRGSDKTAAVTVKLGDRTKLSVSDVRVEVDGDTTTLRIARGLLPAVREEALPAPAPKALPAPEPAPKQLPASTPATTPEPAPATVTVTTEELTSGDAASAATALGARKAATSKVASPGLKLNTGESSPMPMLLAISALLALSYGGLTLLIKKKRKVPGTDIPAIDVISQRRIGPRHQLVIVRAFDRDYLLSIQGGQTTVVARSSRKKLEAAEALLSPLPKRHLDSAQSRPFERDDEPTFGGELFKQALEKRERAREQTASYRIEQARADARIELEAESPAPGYVEPPASAMSESVSGLLRLRKQSGR